MKHLTFTRNLTLTCLNVSTTIQARGRRQQWSMQYSWSWINTRGWESSPATSREYHKVTLQQTRSFDRNTQGNACKDSRYSAAIVFFPGGGSYYARDTVIDSCQSNNRQIQIPSFYVTLSMLCLQLVMLPPSMLEGLLLPQIERQASQANAD